MRLAARWWLAVAVALLGGAGILGAQVPAGACSMVGIAVDFDGTVVEIDGARLTYRVDRVRMDVPIDGGRLPEPGGTVVVVYEEPTPLLTSGESYRVKGWQTPSADVASQIAYDFKGDCGTGSGTTAPDGSYLGPSSGALSRWWRPVAGVVVIGGGVLALHAFVARRQDRASAA